MADPYARRAQREGYAARSAYKLLELQERFKLLGKGDAALDLGCAPGAWLQVAGRCVGPAGTLVGLDLQRTHANLPPRARTIVGNVFLTEPAALLDVLCEALRQSRSQGADILDAAQSQSTLARFTIVLSDMAPSTTGARDADHHASMQLCHRALDLTPDVLQTGGSLVMKAFEGEAHADLVTRTREMFKQVRLCKPKSSRSGSREIYIVARGHTPAELMR